jgi:hypothetical protein
MSAWGKRQNRSNPYGARLGFESLERREMLSADYVFTLTGGGPSAKFTDADGTKVTVKLMGNGSGAFTLTNGSNTGAPIANMTITGTDSTSQLKITAAGGADNVSTVRTLTVTPSNGHSTALSQFNTTAINVASGGLLTFNGDVPSMYLNNVNNGASVIVNGSVNLLQVKNAIGANASIDVTGTLTSMSAQNLGNGSVNGAGPAQLAAGVLSALTVASQINNAVVESQSAMNSFIVGSIATPGTIAGLTLFAGGNIGNVSVQGAISNSAFAANRSAGSDNLLGTLDDYTINPSVSNTITSATFNGTASDVQLIATGANGTLSGTAAASVDQIDNAISQFIPLQIAQAAASITGFDDDEIWIAVYGQEIVTPGEGVIPNPGMTYYLDATQLSGSGASATPIPISTATLSVGPGTADQAILPSFTLAQWKNASTAWGSNLQFPVPTLGNQYTGRIVISVGAPVQAQVSNAAPYTVAAPTPAGATDPSNGTFYDFLEFTVNNATPANGGLTLDMDTSQVDAFGLPMKLQFFQDAAGTQPFNVSFQGLVTPGSATITSVTSVSSLQIGQPVVGTGIEAGSLIDQINGTTIVLSKPATPANPATPFTASLTAQNAGPVGVEATRDELLSESQTLSLMEFLQTQLDANNEKVRPFLQTAAPYQIAGPVPITGALVDTITNTSNIRIYTNSVAGLNANDQVSVYGVQGMTNANGVYTVGSVDQATNSFTLLNSSVNEGYIAGGVWSIAITGATTSGPGNTITVSATNVSGLSDGDIVQIVNVSGMTAANGFFIVESVNTPANTFTLTQSNGGGQTYVSGGTGPGTLAGTWSIYTRNLRLVSPDDLVAVLPAPTSPNGLNNYYNDLIDEFFLTYLPSSVTVTGMDGVQRTGKGATLSIQSNKFNGSMVTYSGTVQNLGSGANPNQWALVLNGGGQTFVVYYPFSTANRPNQNIYQPKFQIGAPQQWPNYSMSASHMIFGCTGVFADNPFRAKFYNKSDDWSATLGDLENSIASAFNRGIILNDASTWSDRSTWFQQTPGTQPANISLTPQRTALYGVYNYWVEYWHQDGIAVNDLAYAYPYDDKYGTSTNLQLNNVGLAKILLNQWSTTQTVDTTTTFGTPPVSPQQGGSVTVSATVAPVGGGATPTGTVTFFIDGTPINSNNFGSAPPLQPITLNGSGTASLTANLPALPDGSLNRTYTLTAVYSGDATNEPSIASMPLKLAGVNGDFLMGYSGTPSAGNAITINGALPGGVYNGTLAFSINGISMGTINVGLENFSTNVTIPGSLSAGYYTISALFTPLTGGPYTGLLGVNVTG